MFSSTTSYDSNPFPNFPSSSYPTFPFYIDPSEINDFAVAAAANNNNTTNLLLHDPPVVAPFIPTHHDVPSFPEDIAALATNLAVADCTSTVAMLDQDSNSSIVNVNGNSNAAYGGLYCGVVPNLVCTQKPVVAAAGIAKKDRHSKIHTSQGLRDRRVRLSSEIARKFFDLQDMLEFDKPSNTLEWLFTKSENAIKELARSKHNCSTTSCNNNNNNNNCSSANGGDKCSCADPCCDQPQPQGHHHHHDVVHHSGEKSLLVGDSSNNSSSSKGRNKLKWTQRDQDVCVQTKKESRDKARARARERTCYKMSNNYNGSRVVQDLEEIMCPVITATNSNAQVLQQLRSSLQMAQQPYPNHHHHHHLLGDNGFNDNNNVIEESIMMIKRNNNVKPSNNYLMSSCSDEQNLVIPSDYYYASFPYSTATTTPNWDPNETINGCSNNLRGIATMNISTCFMNQW